jgi:hypothetical protein
MAIRSFLAFVVAHLRSRREQEHAIETKRLGTAPAGAFPFQAARSRLGPICEDLAALAARLSFRRKTGDPPDPGQHSVEIFLDDYTVNVRKLLGDLDQGLA